MPPSRLTCLVLALLAFISSLCRADDAPPIQQWIDEAIKAGGGVVTVPPGVHVLPKGLVIRDAKKLALRGMDKEECVLKLPPLVYARTTAATAVGGKELPVTAARGWKAGMRAHIECDGEVDGFTKKPRPYVLAVVAEVKPNRLVLKEPLRFPVPSDVGVRHEDAPNLIEVRGACEGLEIASLTLDGGRVEGDPEVRGHAQLCAVFAAGAYTYEKGPTGPKVKGLEVRDCILQNLFGRGVAFYSVEDCAVQRCSFRDGHDEAVDFDHFSTGCVARGNRVTRWRVAFEINDASRCVVEGNEVQDCGLGLNLWRWCKQDGLNEGNVVRNNLFQRIAGNAIQLGKGIGKNAFEANEVVEAGKNGFSLAGAGQILEGNQIMGSKMQPIAIQEGVHRVDGKEHKR